MVEKSPILETLHSQFAENQNHHQGLFIKFLIALFVLFGGFGFVYVHTADCVIYSQTYISLYNNQIYFSNSILLATTFIVLSILLLLNMIILNIGYGFRRDHHLNMIIRKRELKREYDDIFQGLYNADNKNYWDYLPDFYRIFFWFITASQLFIFIAICSKEGVICFNGEILSLIVFIACILLIVASFYSYMTTYFKYDKNIKSKNNNTN
ncbi:type III secretory pathway component EscU [Dysgonomonadaceae bacterium PH5-43]|nr:type III secretory pathway component EscU [Dysgonomonadaceae bacterium PH5-43]